MKLHYSKILLFVLPLNILLTLYHVHNKNKPYITQHTPTTTSRLLSECDIHPSIYNNDEDMESVKENFERQTSQRFEEYQERMKEKRQKRKEQRDKNIQKIIEKDRMDKSLAQKVEKGCLMCGCGLGGVAASVGLFGGLGIYGWKTAALATAKEAAKDAAMAAGEVARLKAGKDAVIEGITKVFGVSTLGGQKMESFFTTTFYTDFSNIAHAINIEYQKSSCLSPGPVAHKPICSLVLEKSEAVLGSKTRYVSHMDVIKKTVGTIVTDAKSAAAEAAEKATEESIKNSIAVVESTYASCQNAIIASVGALLIIVLVMIIIYLVLRYRRKNKMNKKAHYTKLLNE
ncbi:hypothetical protein PFAG_00142 [Plasmodium falciparum Santa Lucia]|uniref:Surface antigen n=1 Tax=Plasmodium falciparum Santa Lucia TaxID=478859 RepID=W7FWW7_PLAFA|nr:hypothetical protein PFAG_00142 [Plasmodium falciparum Santa Lucia]